MATSKVSVRLSDDTVVDLATDNPNIGNLVEKIVELRKSLKVDEIEVVCDEDGFDAKSFAEIVRDSTRQFLSDIALEKKAYENVMSGLKNGNSKSANSEDVNPKDDLNEGVFADAG